MRCSHCGAALGPGAAWCGLCLTRAGAAAQQAAPVAVAERPEPPQYSAVAARMALAGGVEVPQSAPPAQTWPGPIPVKAPAATAGRATVAAIGVGALSQAVYWWITRGSVENEAAIRYSIVTTLAVYAVVAVIVLRRVANDEHPLRWRGSWGVVPSAVLGLLVGGGLAKFLLAATEAAGQEGGDSRIALLVSEGDFPHIAAAVLIAVVAAPFLEELLFRGLLLASLTHRGTRTAVWVSAVAFAAWHLNPSALRYYSLMGALLGALFLKKGLACSIAAHAAFNGVLVLAAVTYALGPGVTATTGDLTMRTPQGWHHSTATTRGIHLTGPSGGEVLVFAVGPYDGAPLDRLLEFVESGQLTAEGFEPRVDTARVTRVPVGEVMRVSVVADGRDGELVYVTAGGTIYAVVLASGGSPRVRSDFERMLNGLTVDP